MRKIKLQKSQIQFLKSIAREAIIAFRDWLDECPDVRKDLELKLNEIGKKYGVVLHDYIWIIENHINPKISAEEKMNTLENFCISLPFDEEDSEYEEERGKLASWIWTFRPDPNMTLKSKIRFNLYSQADARCNSEFEFEDDEFVIDCCGNESENEESEKLSEEYLKSFFAKTCDANKCIG